MNLDSVMFYAGCIFDPNEVVCMGLRNLSPVYTTRFSFLVRDQFDNSLVSDSMVMTREKVEKRQRTLSNMFKSCTVIENTSSNQSQLQEDVTYRQFCNNYKDAVKALPEDKVRELNKELEEYLNSVGIQCMIVV